MKCKIKVLRKTLHRDLADTYCQREPEFCEYYQEGEEFLIEGPVLHMPKKFCPWAWTDLHKVILTLMSGGNFGSTRNWMKEDSTMISCCTDGIRPVIFSIERLVD